MRIADTIVLTTDHLQQVVSAFSEHDAFCFDVEAQGPNRNVPTQNSLSWLSMATTGLAVAIPFGHPNGDKLLQKAFKKKNKLTGKFDTYPARWEDPPEQMLPSEVFGILKPLFFSDRLKIAHNATYDLISTAKYFGEPAPPPYSDTIVLQWLLDENMKQKGLKELVKRYYGVDYDEEHVGKCVEAYSFSKVGHYAYMDAKYTWLLWKKLNAEIERQGLAHIRDIELDVLAVLVRMGLTGAPVNEEEMRRLIAEMSDKLVEAEARIYQAAGRKFNLNAAGQKATILYAPKREGGQGLKPRKLTDGGKKKSDAGIQLTYSDYSTDQESLEYFEGNPVVDGLLEYAEIAKLRSYPETYLGVEGDKDKPRRIFDGRIYPDFVQYGTTTGRFSCREPNLQNVPRPNTELGKKVRNLFVAPPGHKLVVADYGQIELVMFAHFAEPGRLYKGFHEGIDPHTMTAAGVLGKDPEDVTDDERQKFGKTLNFSMAFGAGPPKVAALAEVSVKEAEQILEIHQRTFPELYRFKKNVITTCRSRRPPHVKTLLGRVRRLPSINAAAKGPRMYAERQAVSAVIQGSAADLIKLAMIRANDALPDDMSLILTVHDELVTICPDDRVEVGKQIIQEALMGEEMQKLVTVPLTASIKPVDSWGQAK